MNEPAEVRVAQVDARPPRQAALYCLALGTFAIGTEGFMIAAILPNIAADLVISVALAGSLISIFALAYALSSPILTALTGKVDRRTLLLAAMTTAMTRLLNIIRPTETPLVLAVPADIASVEFWISWAPKPPALPRPS